MLKHINIPIKRNLFEIKALNIVLFRPAIRNDVKNNLIQLNYINLSDKVAPGKEVKYSFRSIKGAAYCITLRLQIFNSAAHHALFS